MALFRGFAIPFAPKNGVFPGMLEDDALIDQNLITLFNIAFNERVRHPERGNDFHALVFETFDEGFIELVKHAVQSLVAQYESRVILKEIVVYQAGDGTDPSEVRQSDDPRVRVNVTYVSLLSKQERTIALPLPGL